MLVCVKSPCMRRGAVLQHACAACPGQHSLPCCASTLLRCHQPVTPARRQVLRVLGTSCWLLSAAPTGAPPAWPAAQTSPAQPACRLLARHHHLGSHHQQHQSPPPPPQGAASLLPRRHQAAATTLRQHHHPACQLCPSLQALSALWLSSPSLLRQRCTLCARRGTTVPSRSSLCMASSMCTAWPRHLAPRHHHQIV